jgi:hypothetical protein
MWARRHDDYAHQAYVETHLPSPASVASVGSPTTGARHDEAYKENLGEAEYQPQHSELEKAGERARTR